jgi:hypothetical protein
MQMIDLMMSLVEKQHIEKFRQTAGVEMVEVMATMGFRYDKQADRREPVPDAGAEAEEAEKERRGGLGAMPMKFAVRVQISLDHLEMGKGYKWLVANAEDLRACFNRILYALDQKDLSLVDSSF